MAIEPAFGGRDLIVSRVVGSGGSEVVTPIGMVTTKELQRTNQFDDASTPDPDAPGAIVQQSSYLKMSATGLNLSGICKPLEFADLMEDAQATTPTHYRFAIGKPLAAGGGHWDVLAWFDNIHLTSQDNGVAKFTAQLRAEGSVAWTPAVT